MPTYEYECTKCKETFEMFQKINDPAPKGCPRCGGKVRRLISGGCGLIFKGSGFYITDYKKKHSSPGRTKASDSKDPPKHQKSSASTEKKESSCDKKEK